MGEKQILVVDDEQSILNLYSQAFSREGYIVRAAKTAEEALEIFEQEQYWVLFLDLNLPGMNGVELCRQICKEWPMVIPYAVTGYASVFELAECREAGFEDYFIKPVKKSDLISAAEHAFKKLEKWKKNK